jgi:signal recognition particle receptor subunit beta
MPLLDGRSRDIVLRIVYDGAPEAGKTTNLQHLCERISLQRRGELSSPGTTSARTMFFDWLDVTGGYVAGRRVRCQLLTVPGQASRLRRRKYLLRSADAVIIVCDSRPECVADNQKLVEQLQRVLNKAIDANAPPVGLVLQANKQDLDAALGADELRDALELPPTTQAIAAEAHVGNGVMEAFTLGVRLAVDRVRALVAMGGIEELGQTTERPEDLLRTVGAMAEDLPEPSGLDRVAAAASSVSVSVPVDAALPLPPAPPLPLSNLPAGQIWPPVRGRAAIASLAGEAEVSPRPRAWAPDGSLEVRCGTWTLHTRDGWLFPDVDRGRAALINAVRRHMRLGPLLPDGRSVALGADDSAWRLWLFTADVVTLQDELTRVVQSADAQAVAATVHRAVRAATAARDSAAKTTIGVELGLGRLAASRDAIAYLGHVHGDRTAVSDDSLAAMLEREIDATLSDSAEACAAVSTELNRLLATADLSSVERRVLERFVA